MKKDASSFAKFKAKPRKAMRISQEDLVGSRSLSDGQTLPRLYEAKAEGLNLATWAEGQTSKIEADLGQFGGLLFRNFAVKTIDDFEKFIRVVGGGALEYTERSSPRHAVSGKIYTSTDYPPEQPIFLHNEQSYNLTFPTKILFYCVKKAEQQGATPIADSRKIYQRLDPEIRQRFVDQGYRYVRNFGDGLGLTWQEAFQNDNKAAIEEYCANNDIEFEWRDDGRRLRTSQLRRVVVQHPLTGVNSWFNHLTFFHVSALVPSVRDTLLAEFAEEDLPNNTYYGDGSPIEAEVMDHLRGLYEDEMVVFDWQEGDVLLLDNVMVAHGRQPFVGERKVVVGMADPIAWADI